MKYTHENWNPHEVRKAEHPKWFSFGYWFTLPKGLDTHDFIFQYYTKIEALMALRSVIAENDPLTVALHVDHIRLYKEILCSYSWSKRRRKDKKPLTLAEKRFVLGGLKDGTP